MNEANKLAGTIRKLVEDVAGRASIHRAVVSSINSSDATLGVKLSGDSTEITGVRYVQQYHPRLNDSVILAKQRNSMVVLDRVAHATGESGSEKADAAQADIDSHAGHATHTHVDTFHAGSETFHHDASVKETTNVTNMGLDSGLTYIGVITPATDVAGPSDKTLNVDPGDGGPGRDMVCAIEEDNIDHNSITLYSYRAYSNTAQTLFYMMSEVNNPIV